MYSADTANNNVTVEFTRSLNCAQKVNPARTSNKVMGKMRRTMIPSPLRCTVMFHTENEYSIIDKQTNNKQLELK